MASPLSSLYACIKKTSKTQGDSRQNQKPMTGNFLPLLQLFTYSLITFPLTPNPLWLHTSLIVQNIFIGICWKRD